MVARNAPVAANINQIRSKNENTYRARIAQSHKNSEKDAERGREQQNESMEHARNLKFKWGSLPLSLFLLSCGPLYAHAWCIYSPFSVSLDEGLNYKLRPGLSKFIAFIPEELSERREKKNVARDGCTLRPPRILEYNSFSRYEKCER